jgi:hypothetical protein
MNQLLQIGDLNQRQKICFAQINANGGLLLQKSKDWNFIKNMKFMTINGQHSIMALQEL